MKIQFDPDLEYQAEAIEAATSIFEGQEICKTTFSMPSLVGDTLDANDMFANTTDLGTGNKRRLLDEEVLANIQKIQLQNGLKQSKKLYNGKDGQSPDFMIEMETGTGKTYVYLRSMFEMHKRYGFTKFIIVVPSIAIKEGVYKSLEMTETHFKELYDNINYDYFVYDSDRLEQVRSFATNDYLQIMVINIDAFRRSFTDPSAERKANIIHRWNDRMQGVPMDFIRSTNPIVIIDEPQSVDTTNKAKAALDSLNAMCTYRYSATHLPEHKKKYHMLYRLDSIDAYERQLVKQIEVASIQIQDNNNQPYIKLLNVDNKNGFKAKIELNVRQGGGTVKKTKWVKQNEDLVETSGGLDLYQGYIVNDIYCEEGNEYIDFTSQPDILRLNHAIGDVDEDSYKRLQIKKTIEEHLEKELKLRPKGIKVLSLFFIDRVDNYRIYDEGGNQLKGKYAQYFEEEYQKLIKKPKYATLFEDVDTETLPEDVHNGYFSIDRKHEGRSVSEVSSNLKCEELTYNLIMKDKEKLLSFDSKLKFIFSHSALKEGWDNPNVFQICTLNETRSQLKKRQEIGRGLRIAVNQNGQRVHGFDVNTLTVMANESYEDFVEGLQKEIEKEEGIKFGVVEEHLFANITFENEDGERQYLGADASEKIWEHLLASEYITDRGRIEDKLKADLKNDELELPKEYEDHKVAISATLKKVAGKLNVKNADDRRNIRLNKAVFESAEFNELWERIKYKTTYHVEFEPEALIEKCAETIKNKLIVGKPKYVYERAAVDINRSRDWALEDRGQATYVYDIQDYQIPDILSYLQNETNLTRRSLYEILKRSEQLDKFKNNPQKFLDGVKDIIKNQMQHFIVDGIKYEKIGDGYYYTQEIFENQELIGYLKKNMVESEKSVYDYVVYDSDIEMNFARDFENNEDVKVYAKLPKDFQIDTPLGPYNPDWAVLMQIDGHEKLYFVVESKGSMFEEALRESERGKIECGREHFKALETDAEYILASNYNDLLDQATG